MIDHGKSNIKDNLYKLLEYSNSLKHLKNTFTVDHAITTKNNYFYIFIFASISSGLALFSALLYIKFKNNYNKKTNCIEEEAKPKVYEELSIAPEPTPGKSLPKII